MDTNVTTNTEVTDTEEEINTEVTGSEETTNVDDVPHPFPAPLALPDEPVVIDDVSASDPTEQGEVSVRSLIQVQGATQLPMVQQTAVAPAPTTTAPLPYVCGSGMHYFKNGEFDQDCAENKSSSKYPTGYANIDKVSGFGPGLYVLGAGSSMGKTTFCVELADKQAMMGRHILYFAMEQSKFDLYPKSLARGSFLEHEADKAINRYSNLPRYTNNDIRERNMDNNEIKRMFDMYSNSIGDRVHIIEGCFGKTIEEICDEVKRFMDATGEKPLVIVDYLQAVSKSTVNGRRLEGKDSIDHIVMTLKAFQIRNKLIVVLISSLNRNNYMAPIDYESFKESGSIEYTADTVWGLQPHVLSQPGFYNYIDKNNGKLGKETNIKHKRDMLRAAKAASPRRIDFVCLKNRYGEATYSVQFDYEAAFDTFVPII